MAIFQLNNAQADTMFAVARGRLPIIAILGVGVDDDHDTATKLGEFAQNVYDLAGLGLLEPWDTEKGKAVASQMSEESNRTVQIYSLTNVGKLMFRESDDRVVN